MLKEAVFRFLNDPLYLKRWERPIVVPPDETRISIPVYGYRSPIPESGPQVSMFIEDIHQGIMPFRDVLRNGSEVSVVAEGADGHLTRMLASALARHSYESQLFRGLGDFVRDAAQSLFAFGRAAFEVIIESDDSGAVTRFELEWVHPLTVRRLLGRYYQIVPWWMARKAYTRVDFLRFPRNRLIWIDYPKELGGRAALKKTLRRLKTLGREFLPSFHMEAIQDNQNIGFDLQQYRKEKYFEIGRLTRSVGWDQRRSDETVLEYYQMWRSLTKALSQAIVRENIVLALNETLQHAELPTPIRIVMNGVPTTAQIRQELRTLESGNVTFAEVLSRVSLL